MTFTALRRRTILRIEPAKCVAFTLRRKRRSLITGAYLFHCFHKLTVWHSFRHSLCLIFNRKRVHGNKESAARVTPIKILSKRPGEFLCKTAEDNCEWINVEDVDSDFTFADVEGVEPTCPIIQDINPWLESGAPFTEKGPNDDIE